MKFGVVFCATKKAVADVPAWLYMDMFNEDWSGCNCVTTSSQDGFLNIWNKQCYANSRLFRFYLFLFYLPAPTPTPTPPPDSADLYKI